MTDLLTVFATDPLKLTRDDLTFIVKELRDRRKQFNLGAASAGKVKPSKAKPGPKLDLGGIDL